jgi:hypothetical protein
MGMYEYPESVVPYKGREGFLYFATNKSMPNLIKIGMTNKSPYMRLNELESTGVPGQFELLGAFFTKDSAESERVIHNRYESIRFSKSREFFTVEDSSAVKFLIECGEILYTKGLLEGKIQYYGIFDPDSGILQNNKTILNFNEEIERLNRIIKQLKEDLNEKQKYKNAAIHGIKQRN